MLCSIPLRRTEEDSRLDRPQLGFRGVDCRTFTTFCPTIEVVPQSSAWRSLRRESVSGLPPVGAAFLKPRGPYDASFSSTVSARVYPDRVTGRDRHYRRADRFAAAGRAKGP